MKFGGLKDVEMCQDWRTSVQHTPQSQHPLTPKFHPRPSSTESFDSVSSILLLNQTKMEEGQSGTYLRQTIGIIGSAGERR